MTATRHRPVHQAQQKSTADRDAQPLESNDSSHHTDKDRQRYRGRERRVTRAVPLETLP